MGVTDPEGFVAGGVAAGIKAGGRPDMALVAVDDGRAVPAAGVFTRNLAVAAPVRVSRAHLMATAGRAAAVLLTSGNANAATGSPGMAAAAGLCASTAGRLGVPADEVLLCQTGLIGVPFPLSVAEGALDALTEAVRPDGPAATEAATAIMTTDSRAKEAVVDAAGFTVGGMGKGAAMLAPDMATMLAVLTTDAACDPATLRRALGAAVGPTFNSMTIDGCTSTNDTVLVLASGRAGPADASALTEALTEVCADLAEQMVADAEGGRLVATVRVTGARTDAEAGAAARRVADSLLVKCSLNGEDPYWGRVVSELGSAGVGFELDRVAVSYGGVTVCRGGVAADHDREALAAHMKGSRLDLHCELGLGSGSGSILATDLGYGYIDENRTTS